MADSKRKTRQLRKLFDEQGGKCHWCHVEMVLMIGVENRHKTDPLNRATLDHLEHRWDPMRGRHQHGAVRHVAACFKCNVERGAEFVRSQPPELVRMMSNRHRVSGP